MTTYNEREVLSTEEFAAFCAVHGKSPTRLGAFVRTACQLQEALKILQPRRTPGVT